MDKATYENKKVIFNRDYHYRLNKKPAFSKAGDEVELRDKVANKLVKEKICSFPKPQTKAAKK